MGTYRGQAPLFRMACLGLVCLLLAGCLVRPGKQTQKLTYRLPTSLVVEAGSSLAGTNIRYDGMEAQGARVSIEGLTALKRRGDSLDWVGTPLSGVSVKLALRVLSYSDSELRLVGIATLVIEKVNPRPGPVLTSSPLKYTGAVGYGVAKGAAIPGSTITYVGRTDDGATLGNVEGYPHRKVGDSIFWEGTLRDGVYLRLNVRALQFDDRGLRVGGLATLWLGQ